MAYANGTTYCKWCEEKPSTREWFPYCSRFCCDQHICRECKQVGRHKLDCSNGRLKR